MVMAMSNNQAMQMSPAKQMEWKDNAKPCKSLSLEVMKFSSHIHNEFWAMFQRKESSPCQASGLQSCICLSILQNCFKRAARQLPIETNRPVVPIRLVLLLIMYNAVMPISTDIDSANNYLHHLNAWAAHAARQHPCIHVLKSEFQLWSRKHYQICFKLKLNSITSHSFGRHNLRAKSTDPPFSIYQLLQGNLQRSN